MPKTSPQSASLKRKSAIILLSAATAVLFLFILYRLKVNSIDTNAQTKQTLLRLSTESYESVLLSMHSPQSFRKEDFAYYRGHNTLVVEHAVLNTEELSRYLEQIFLSENEVSNLFLCLDPEILWLEAKEKTSRWSKNLAENLYSYIDSHPDVTFEVLLPSPYIDYWLSFSEDALSDLLGVYHTLVNELSAYSNAKVYFPGYEYWLMINPGNYTLPPFDMNETLAQQLIRYTFCDGAYQITPLNEDFFWNSLRAAIRQEQESPAFYPDLSGWRLVFFGDSIFATSSGSLSIPGYISGLSHAAATNLAVGGSSAVTNFSSAADSFLSEETPKLCQQKLCFIINYGFNDYFNGVPLENTSDLYDSATYKGSLRSCILRLQAAYPDACFILVAPTHTAFYDNGTMIPGENGAVLEAYVNAAEEISKEMGTHFIDNYHNFVINEETINDYLSDGCHPNEKGRLAIACRIMEYINDFLQAD